MLLKKQETDNKTKSIYESSNICASIYDKSNNSLTIIFNNGGQYIYEGVTSSDYLRFEVADSQGAVFNSHLKKYPFQKLDKVDVKDILVEIDSIKNIEDKIKINHTVGFMVDKMRSVCKYYESTGELEIGLLTKVREAITEYDKINKVNE
jgi:hypothetical protein